MEITVTPEERSAGRMSQAQVDQAVAAIHAHGYVILNNTIDHDHLDILREKMTEDSHKLIDARKWGGAGRLPGHLQQGPPPCTPYVFADIVANPFAIQVTRGVLGEGLYNSFYSGNTNCPGSSQQPLHADHGHLWPNLQVAHPPAMLVINIALRDVSEENGAIELWPGTHRETRPISDELVAERRAEVPPIRGETRKGSLLIRDMRLWHRGVPNRSDQLRHMIALVHNIRWRARPRILPFQTGCEEAFASDQIDHNVEFVDEPIDYLFGKFIAP